MNKYRIQQRIDGFYPQKRVLFFWEDMKDCGLNAKRGTLKEAMQFLEDHELWEHRWKMSERKREEEMKFKANYRYVSIHERNQGIIRNSDHVTINERNPQN